MFAEKAKPLMRVGSSQRAVTAMAEMSVHLDNNNWKDIRKELNSSGFVLLRNQIPVSHVLDARRVVLRTLAEHWDLLSDPEGADATIAPGKGSGMLLTGFRSIVDHPDVRAVLEGPELFSVISKLATTECSTYKLKWVRVIGKDENTEEHSDYYRFSRHASMCQNNMYVCWVPLGDYKVSDSTLVVASGSHHHVKYDSSSEIEEELPPGIDLDNFDWKTSDVAMGDIVVFDIRSVHASTNNTSGDFRLSIDTRWMPTNCICGDLVDSFTSEVTYK